MLDNEYRRDNQINIAAPSRISISNMRTMDSNLKKMVEKAASYKLEASFLMVPQAMQAAGFSDEEWCIECSQTDAHSSGVGKT